MPDNEYLFVSDTAAFPYGTKAEDDLIERVLTVSQKLLDKFSPDIFIIACNTASTVTLPYLRAKFDVPFVGVVPAIKPAAALSSTKVIGLLATPATIERSYTDDLIAEFASDCHVIKVGSSALVELAEKKLANNRLDATDSAQIKNILQPFLNEKTLDTLVLACTHFPLLSDEIQSVFEQHNHNVQFVDSGLAIAARVQTVLTEMVNQQGDSFSSSAKRNQAWFTSLMPNDNELTHYLTELGISEAQLLNLS